MRRYLFFVIWLACSLAMSAQVRLSKVDSRSQIEVQGQPMLILGGELSNSAATSIADIDEVMPRMASIGLNTVLVPAQWDLIEPIEGQFDFSTIDETVKKARENGLKVIFLWFGAWKNSMSCYAPMWFKQDTKRFPRARTAQGKPLEIASAFSEDVFLADNRAFAQLIRHIRDIDSSDNTVIMIQVENEIGMLEAARDHSSLAERVWRGDVPQDIRKAMGWKKGSWADVVGESLVGEEQFQAYYYAKYVERLAQTATHIYDIPLYVNAAMNSRGRKPGEYPSAGPLAHLADIWKTAAPSVPILAPDIYDTGFKSWASQYDMGKKNPLFIPESRCCENSGVRALYVFGEHEAVGFSPFAIDQASASDSKQVSRAYSLLKELSPILLKQRGQGSIRGMLFDQEDMEKQFHWDGMTITARHYFTLPWDSRATDGSRWREGGGIIIRVAKDEYLVAGSGIVVTFQTDEEMKQTEKAVLGEDGFADKGSEETKGKDRHSFSAKRIGIGTVDEVHVDPSGGLTYIRRLNGDQSHQGRHARISVDEYTVLRIRLYSY